MINLLLSAQAHYLEATFDEIDRRFGSFDAYLTQGLGIDEATRARLVALLTESAPPG